MIYYIYILSGPLKNTKFSLVPEHYLIYLYKKHHEINDNNEEKATLYIPCDNEQKEIIISLTLSDESKDSIQYTIENSIEKNEIGNIFNLNLDEPLYINDIPILFISKESNLSLPTFQRKKIKQPIKYKKIVIGIFIFIILLSSSLFFIIPKKSEQEIAKQSMDNLLSFNGFHGQNGYYCIVDDSFFPEENIIDEKNKFQSIDRSTINKNLNNKNKHIINIIFKDNQKPIINFLYHNASEEKKIIESIDKIFPSNCKPNIHALSLPNIIENINNFSFIQEIGYTIQEQKNKVIFIFDDKLSKDDKVKLESFIKKQTTIFGRKFIAYDEKISDPNLSNKGILQEDGGYIFINDKHRYFPQG